MDDVDRATAWEQLWRDNVLAQQRRPPVGPAGDGLCAGCGEPIPPARLAVLPRAARCVDCQAELERLR